MAPDEHCDHDAQPHPEPAVRAAGSSVGKALWLLVVAAFATLEGGEAIVVEDGGYFSIVNNSAPNARVHVIVSEQSRFILNIRFESSELGGTLKMEYLQPVNGKKLTHLTLQNEGEIEFASSRMDLGATTAEMQATYVLPDGRVLMNATLVITPFSYTGNTLCTTHWDCRVFKSNCTGGFCTCDSGYKFNKRELYCAKICNDDSECGYLGPSNRECFLKKCACTGETKLAAGKCGFPKGCASDSVCSAGSICESTKCVCEAGTVRSLAGAGCTRKMCTSHTDCGFWLHTECGRYSPVSKDKACRCANGTALLMGSCNPITDLGPCPYGKCTTEYSQCNSATRTCLCNTGYELRVYGKLWVCEKLDIEDVERRCNNVGDCWEGEICEDEICKCPRGKEHQGTKCVDIKIPPQKSNLLKIILWLSAVMLALIVAFASFGCCLYLLAQRAENEQMAIVRMFEGSGDEGAEPS